MSLYPGGKSPSNSSVYSLENDALANSMAQEMENEMNALFLAVKGQQVPETGQQDRRLLFVAISRGMLKYLQNNEAGNAVALDGGTLHTHPVDLVIDMDKFA